VPPRVLCSFLHKMQVALATCSMGKTVQKAPGADGLRRLWTWAKQCKKHLEQMAYAACGHGQTVQKAPGVDSKRRLWPCDRSGGARWLRPPPSHLPPSPHLPGGLEHVRHLGPGRWLQVASAPLSHLHAPPRHTWRAGARAPPGRHFGNFIVRVLLNRNVLYTASAPRAAPAAPPQSTLATLPRSQHTTSARPTKLCMAWFIGDRVMAYYRAVFSLASQTAQRRQQRRVSSAATGSCGVCSHTKRPRGPG
jgi:hypothetical protein